MNLKGLATLIAGILLGLLIAFLIMVSTTPEDWGLTSKENAAVEESAQ